LFVVLLATAVLGWPAGPAQAWGSGPANAVPDRPAEPRSDGAACGTGAGRPYVLTSTPVLAARQSDPDVGQQDLTTTFVWWRTGVRPSGVGRVSQSAGNPSTVSAGIPAGRLVDGGTYAWRARTFDGRRYGPWSAQCEFTVDVTSPEPPAGVTSTDYPADGPHGGVGVAGQFMISPPALRPAEVVAYAWTLDSGVGPAGAATIEVDEDSHGATLRFAPTRDGVQTLRVWSKDRAGRFSTPVTYSFMVTATTVPQPTRPRTPSISFPDGNSTVQGGTLSMRLDANGDQTVTEFRYSVGTTSLNLTAVPDVPGGSVVVQIPVGNVPTSAGNVFAVASTGTVSSLLTAGTFEVRSLTSLTGRTVDISSFLPVAGAVVRLEPGGHEATTTADGEFSFLTGDVPAGVYTLTASYGGCSTELPLEVSGGGHYVEVYLMLDGCGI
jgi:hypothetical protein